MKLAFIIDSIHLLNLPYDTSVAMMRKALSYGHEVWTCEQKDLTLEKTQVFLYAQDCQYDGNQPFSLASYKQGEKQKKASVEFDVILMRKNPPFDQEFLYSTYLLEQAEKNGTLVLNNPNALRNWNEKLSIVNFPQFAPPFIVTSQAVHIHTFLEQQHDIILKPLNSMGGDGIFRLKKEDYNLNAIIETQTMNGKRTMMVQRYCPEIIDGDKRILIIDGVPFEQVLVRFPQQGETRANLALGGKGVVRLLNEEEKEIAQIIGKGLKEQGLFFVGIDMIGYYITEINVTSPTAIVEITRQTGIDATDFLITALEKYERPSKFMKIEQV